MLAQQCHSIIKLHLGQWGGVWPSTKKKKRMRGAIMPCLIFWLPFLSRKKVKTRTICQQAYLEILEAYSTKNNSRSKSNLFM